MQAKSDSSITNFLDSKKNIFWNTAIIILVFTGVLVAVSTTHTDPDLWGHVRFGLDTLELGSIPRYDPYSYLTGDYPWINHQWLAEITLALGWTLAGSTGLIVVKVLLWTAIFAMIFITVNKPPLYALRAGILLLLTMPLLAPFYITIRPQVYTALLFTLTLLVILQAEKGKYIWLWALIPIYALWSNLHGAFLIGLGTLGVWAILHLLTNRERKIWLNVIPPILLGVLATLLNPYGIDLWVHLLNHLGDTRLEITEWRPLQIHSLRGVIYLFWIILSVLGFIYKRIRVNLPIVFVFIMLAYLPLISVRHLLFFALALPLLAFPIIGDAWDRFMPARPAPRKLSLLGVLLPITSALILLIARPPNFKTIPIALTRPFPVNAVSILEESGLVGNLAVHFDWGDYAIWHLAPNIKVSLDTRREMAYPEEIYRMNLRNITGSGDWDTLLDEHPTDMLLVKRDTALHNLIALKPGWVNVYQDEHSVLYARAGSEQASLLTNFAEGYQAPEHELVFP